MPPYPAMQMFDLAVQGAGPAGSAAARAACALGLRVALIDRADFPRDKLCGGLVSGRSLALLDSLFALPATDPLFHAEARIAFHWSGTPLARFTLDRPLRFTMRRAFDARLRAAALNAGAVPFLASIDAMAPDGTLSLSDGSTIHAACVLGADGVNSSLARRLFGRAFDPGRIGFGLEVEWPSALARPETVIDFGAARWGYGWVFPKAEGTTIGVGGLHVRNPDLKSSLARMLPEGAPPRIKGQYIPFGAFRRRPGQGAILFAGDAAGLVDPITGEGIALAMESGRLAAEAVRDALDQGAPARAARLYQRRLAPIHAELRRARRLRILLFSTVFHRAIRGMLAQSTRARTLMFDLLDGRVSYRTLQARALTALPRLLARGLFGR
jgi:geranylgeranyl reductase family protein